MTDKGRKTRKQQQRQEKAKAPSAPSMTIPELRHAFEYIEHFVQMRLSEPMNKLVPQLQEEWKKVFYKELDTKSAHAYIEYVKECHEGAKRRHTRKRGGATALEGAPIDYTLRAGLYITPGIDQGSYAMVPKYVASGFWNPEPARSYDPVPGQTHYPTRTPAGFGENTVASEAISGGGKRRGTSKKLRGGSAILSQAFMRPIISSSPPSFGQDMETMWNGQILGASPQASQPNFKFMNPLQ